MEKIPSFTIDHNRLLRGIYVSRKDHIGDVTLTTFDIRMKEPNRQAVMSQEALHTIEHLAATYLRNDAEWKDKIVYWGPMGCCTGNYLILAGDYESRDIVELMKRTFEFIRDYTGIVPGTEPKDCGNYSCHSLDGAKREAETYLNEVLNVITEENLYYPA